MTDNSSDIAGTVKRLNAVAQRLGPESLTDALRSVYEAAHPHNRTLDFAADLRQALSNARPQPSGEGLVEAVAQTIYAQWSDKPGYVSWVARGNSDKQDEARRIARQALAAHQPAPPIPMLLFCPNCGGQHVDEPDERTPEWTNPPHRSHLCHNCGCIWRPADIPTEGVLTVETRGKADTWPHQPPSREGSES